jgi:type IX secretion system PorP/SprF family membrane protein
MQKAVTSPIHFLACMMMACCMVSIAIPVTAQQKEQFTQYMFNGLILNPAVAGNDEALSISFINRRQWSSIDGAPVTQTLTAHTLFNNKHAGIGISLVNDKIGVHKNQSFQGSYSYRLNVSEHSYLAMGLQAGLNAYRSDYSSLLGAGLNDPKVSNGSISSTAFTVGAGLFYRSSRFSAGLSAPEIVPHKISVSDTMQISWQKSQYFLFVRYSIPLNATLDLEPSMLIKYMRGVPVSYDVNACLLIKKVLTLGMSYRKQESIDFLMKAQVTPQLQVGYSYDYGTGKLSRGAGGTHELLVNYIFKYTKTNVASPR